MKLYRIISTVFYVGKVPFAPGTFGSIVALFLFYYLSIIESIVLLFIVFVISIDAINQYAKEVKSHDHSSIVIDEVVGMGLTMLFIPQDNIEYALLAFILFRLFDITKPYPIGLIDREVQNAYGTMLDDVMAGIYAAITINIIMIFI